MIVSQYFSISRPQLFRINTVHSCMLLLDAWIYQIFPCNCTIFCKNPCIFMPKHAFLGIFYAATMVIAGDQPIAGMVVGSVDGFIE